MPGVVCVSIDAARTDIDLDKLDGTNGFVLLSHPDYSFYGQGFTDVSGDGIDDLVNDYGGVLVEGRPEVEGPLGVQGLTIATGPSTTFLTWDAPDVENGASQIQLTVDGEVIATLDADLGAYQFNDPAPHSRKVLSALIIDDSEGRSPVVEHFLSNEFQGISQLRASVYGSNLVELFWDNVPAQYFVWRDGELYAEVSGNSFTDTNVEAGVNYQYHITQGPNAYGLNLGRSPTSANPNYDFVCTDYCDDYAPLQNTECQPYGHEDYRTTRLRSLFPGSTDPLVVSTDQVGSEFVTPDIAPTSTCIQPEEIYLTSLGHQVYSDTAVELFWERIDSAGVTFEVYRDTELLATLDGTSYFDGNATNSYHFYSVFAVGSNGARSNPIIYDVELYDPGTEPAIAPASVELRAEVYSSSAIELFWGAIYSEDGSSIDFAVIRDNDVLGFTDGLSYFDDTLEPGTTYTYNVITQSSSGYYPLMREA